ncbi:MAG: Phosphoribosylglycinamide formyltransferase [Candidatus Omnitrophica bacterium ADurb.Bin205]|nr:MAG: Phosphoribosylglycinamide formyltransferase [Candidatus Omnitrophica bacterium ADurb.Bin205]
MKRNIAVFASGRGSNFIALAKEAQRGRLKGANLALLVCDNPNAPVISAANKLKIKTLLVNPAVFPNKKAFEDAILRHLKENKIGLIVLAGFMRILSARFVKLYKNRIMNIHPSLLPAFKGAHAIKDAFGYGIKITGVTVHFVDDKMDHGPIILQREVAVLESETVDSLEEKIHKVEHNIYPEAVNLFIKGRLKVKGRKVLITTH